MGRAVICQMDQFPCPCRGETPNCFRCFGTGLIPNPVPLVGRPHRDFAQAALEAESKRGKPRKKVKLSRKIISGNKEAPPHAKVDKKPQIEFTAPSYKKCPDCGLVLRSKSLGKHRRNVHGVDENGVVIDVKPASVRELQRCSVCGVMVKNQEKHFKKAHNKKRVSPSVPLQDKSSVIRSKKVQSQRKISVAQQSKQVTQAGPGNTASFRDEKLDATHGWGPAFRDHGQFGSHPSYDSMDDESTS